MIGQATYFYGLSSTNTMLSAGIMTFHSVHFYAGTVIFKFELLYIPFARFRFYISYKHLKVFQLFKFRNIR